MTSWVERVLSRIPEIPAKTDEIGTSGGVSSVLAGNPYAEKNAIGRLTAPILPWRCYACRGTRRMQRPVWGDWTCGRCGVIVAGPEVTERLWQLGRRYGPVPLPDQPRVVWGQERGYLAVHDSATDTWHEIAYRDAPAVWQAEVRRRQSDHERY